MHLADLDGNQVPDMIQCEDHGKSPNADPSAATWTVHLWKPALGFEPAGETIDVLMGYPCNGELYTVDVNADGKVELLYGSGGTNRVAGTYEALGRSQDGTWKSFDTQLPVVQPGGRLLFADVNGDGLRIRKTTPEEETIYFSGLYERVTSNAAPMVHRYYVRSPESDGPTSIGMISMHGPSRRPTRSRGRPRSPRASASRARRSSASCPQRGRAPRLVSAARTLPARTSDHRPVFPPVLEWHRS